MGLVVDDDVSGHLLHRVDLDAFEKLSCGHQTPVVDALKDPKDNLDRRSSGTGSKDVCEDVYDVVGPTAVTVLL